MISSIRTGDFQNTGQALSAHRNIHRRSRLNLNHHERKRISYVIPNPYNFNIRTDLCRCFLRYILEVFQAPALTFFDPPDKIDLE